jgi:RNA polymerase sigma factor (sigma-70 family)
MQRYLKQDWVLSEDAFNQLLASLDANRQRAGDQYEHLRRSLIRFFDWRGSRQPEIDADETIDRVARKLDQGTPIDDVYTYAIGVARLVLLESYRSQEKEQSISEPFCLPAPDEEDDQGYKQRADCFDVCLAKLPAAKRELIVRYYQGDKRAKIDNRQQLAEHLGMPIGRLRIQAHRIREKLEACIHGCLSSAAEKKTPDR